MSESIPQVGFLTRVWLAYVVFFRVLFQERFAGRALSLHRGEEPKALPEPRPERDATETPKAPGVGPALQLLGLLQREGRLVDFLEEDIATFSDEDVGAAARLVHDGCRKALHEHGKVLPVRREGEGEKVEVEKEALPVQVKLVGHVTGQPPFRGTLRHRGWRVEDLSLPVAVEGHDARVIAPAEVEL